MSRHQTSFSYRPALDGLRAFAVLSVFAYHLNYGWARGGYLGVDAFFVISGYLITSLLLGEDRSSGGIELTAFWGRRARRLLPAVLLLVGGIALFSATWAGAEQLDTLRKDGWATLAYVANWRLIASHQSYFDLFSAPSPLRHMWSLAIEEQFYVVWPLVVFATLRAGRGRRHVLSVVTITGIVASAIWMAVHFDVNDPSRVYYGTDTRAHSLLVGCLLALLLERSPSIGERVRMPLQVAGLVAAAGVLGAVHAVSDNDRVMYRGGFLLYAVAVAVVIAAAVQTTWSPLRAAMSISPLRWIGSISYGLYLWHWPAIVILTPARAHVSGLPLAGVQIAATFAVATASFYLVERPIRYGRIPNRAVLASAPAALALAGILLAATTTGAKKSEFDASAPITAPPVPVTTTPARTTAPPPTQVPGVSTTTPATVPGPTTVAVVGDSVAETIGWGLQDAAKGSPVRVVSSAFAGCGLAGGMVLDVNDKPYSWSKDCYKNVPGVLARMVSEQHPDVVVWSSSWELSDRLDLASNKVLRLGTAAHDAALLASIDFEARRLTAKGAHLVFLTLSPRAPNPKTGKPGDGQDGRYDHYNNVLRKYAREHPKNVTLVDTVPFVCPGGVPCPKEVRGVVLRPEDGTHFTHETAPIIGRWLMPKLLAVAR